MSYFFQFIARSILVLIMGFSFSSVSYAANPAPAATAPASVVAKVVWVKGKLSAINSNKQTRLLVKADSIYLHDTLVTDDKSDAQIVFTDNTLMSFRPGTEFYINDYAFSPKATKGSVGKYIMNLVKGGFRTITGIIAKANPPDYKVNTPVATIGVRGTDYTVYLNKEGGAYFAFTSGSPCITSTRTLCLNKTIPFAQVKALNANPIPLTREPAVFSEKPTILKTTFSNVVQGIAPSPTPVDSRPSAFGSTSGGSSGGVVPNDETHSTNTDNSSNTDQVNQTNPTTGTDNDQGTGGGGASSGDGSTDTTSSTDVNTTNTSSGTNSSNSAGFCIK
jgi:hypothetical protein